jgi:hypothetical protein
VNDTLAVQSLGGHGEVEFDELPPLGPSAARKGVVDLDDHPVGPPWLSLTAIDRLPTSMTFGTVWRPSTGNGVG